MAAHGHESYSNKTASGAWVEEPIEPDLPILDPHHHLRDRPNQRYLFLDFLEDIHCGHNVWATVTVECGAMYRTTGPEHLRCIGETEFLNGIAAMFASGNYGPTQASAGIVGSANLRLGARVQEVIDAHLAAAGGRFRGVRTPVLAHASKEMRTPRSSDTPERLMYDHTWREGFARLGPNKLCFEAWLNFTQLPELVDLAHAFPDTDIVLNHAGGPSVTGPYEGKRDEMFAAWSKNIRTLKDADNIYIKLGGIRRAGKPKSNSSIDVAETWKPYYETCIEAVGPGRCMFESNFPPDKEMCSYTALWNACKRIVAKYSASEKAAMFSGNAAKVYRLTPPAKSN